MKKRGGLKILTLSSQAQKKGAIELSIGTIVIIVLAMSMLILGMVLVKNIFGGATSIVDLNNDQISAKIRDLYGNDKKLVIYPSTDIFEVKSGETSAFAIRVQNLLTGSNAGDVRFSYTIEPEDQDLRDCGLSLVDFNIWMKGETGQINEIPIGEEVVEKILLDIPDGTVLCKFKIRVDVKYDGQTTYAKEQMFIQIKP